MTISFEMRRQINAAEWNEVVENSPDGWVFSLYGWQELILQVEQWALEDHSFGVRENGRLVAVMPLQFNKNDRRMSSSGWGGSGPVITGRVAGKARSRLIRVMLDRCTAIARECGAVSFEFSVSPVTGSSIQNTWGVNPFCFYGFEDHSGLAQVVDLAQPEPMLLARMAADARRQIRIARDRGCNVERVDWSEHLDRYYQLHEETYRRTGVSPHPKAYFSGMAAHTARTGHSVLWAAHSPGGEVVAYHNAAWFAEGGYYHTGCSASEAAEFGVSYLLFWEAMLGAKAAGIRWYDAGAIFPNAMDEKRRGLTTFKRKFGGQPHRSFSCRMVLDHKEDVADEEGSSSRRAGIGFRRMIAKTTGYCRGLLG